MLSSGQTQGAARAAETDPAGRLKEGRRGLGARSEGCREQTEAEEAGDAGDEQVDPLASYYVTTIYIPPLLSRLGQVIERAKRFVQCVDSAHLVDRFRGRPCHRSAQRPNRVDDGQQRRTYADLHAARECVSEQYENGVTEGEGDAVDARASGDVRGDFLARDALVRNGADLLYARRKDKRSTGLVLDSVAPTEPDNMPWKRLLLDVELVVFRVWYAALRWVKILKHKCRLNRPCCDRALRRGAGVASSEPRRPSVRGLALRRFLARSSTRCCRTCKQRAPFVQTALSGRPSRIRFVRRESKYHAGSLRPGIADQPIPRIYARA
jgi:hypothetical protein